MRSILILTFLFFTAATLADTHLIHNANGYSINEGKLVQFEAMAFKEGEILEIGDSEGLLKKYPDAKTIDAKNNTLLPGLHDSHLHILQMAKRKREVDLSQVKNETELISTIKEHIENSPNRTWIIGNSWDPEIWNDNNPPHHSMLDKVTEIKPILIKSRDGFTVWANSKAMYIAERMGNFKTDYDESLVDTDSEGLRTGLFHKSATQMLLPLTINKEFFSSIGEINLELERLTELGVTSVTDMGIDYRTFVTLKKMSANKALTTRYNAFIYFGTKLFTKMTQLPPFFDRHEFLRIQGVSYTLDKDLYDYNAALKSTYSDKSNTQGSILQQPSHIQQALEDTLNMHWQSAFNATGDQANHVALDFLLNNEALSNKQHHRLEKAKIISLDDIKRIKNKNLVISIQPTKMLIEKEFVQDRVGRDRLRGGYAWKTLYNNGAILVSGSDAPYANSNPFWGIHALVNRTRPGSDEKSWIPVERLSVAQALETYTINSAYASNINHNTGSLEPGKWADFILVDQNIFQVSKDKIWQTKVLQTWIDGNKVYQVRNKPKSKKKN